MLGHGVLGSGRGLWGSHRARGGSWGGAEALGGHRGRYGGGTAPAAPPHGAAPPRAPGPEAAPGMGGDTGGSRALLGAALLPLPWAPSLGAVADGGGPESFGSPPVPASDPLWRLGHAAWAVLEGWLGPEPLRLLAEVSPTPLFWGVMGTSGGASLPPAPEHPPYPPAGPGRRALARLLHHLGRPGGAQHPPGGHPERLRPGR